MPSTSITVSNTLHKGSVLSIALVATCSDVSVAEFLVAVTSAKRISCMILHPTPRKQHHRANSIYRASRAISSVFIMGQIFLQPSPLERQPGSNYCLRRWYEAPNYFNYFMLTSVAVFASSAAASHTTTVLEQHPRQVKESLTVFVCSLPCSTALLS